MKFSDLIRDPAGTMSHFKLWNNIASAVFTWIIISRELAGKLSEDLLIWYAGMLIAGVIVSKGVSVAATASEAKVRG
jgi:hypothetical protein